MNPKFLVRSNSFEHPWEHISEMGGNFVGTLEAVAWASEVYWVLFGTKGFEASMTLHPPCDSHFLAPELSFECRREALWTPGKALPMKRNT